MSEVITKEKKSVKSVKDPITGEVTEVITVEPAVTIGGATVEAKTRAKTRLETMNAELEASLDTAVGSFGEVYDGLKLPIYTGIGSKCYDVIYRAKAMMDFDCATRKVPSTWDETYYDSTIETLSRRVRLAYPHVFAPSKDDSDSEAKAKRDPVRIHDYIIVYHLVESLRPLIGDLVDELPYGILANYVARSALAFSKKAFQPQIRKAWIEKLKTELPRVANCEISTRDMIAIVKGHEEFLKAEQANAKNVGKSDVQIAKDKADAEVMADKAKRHAKAKAINESLTTSLGDALAGGLPIEVTQAIVTTVQKNTGVSIFEKPAEQQFDPATVTTDTILKLFQDMMMLNRRAELKAVCEACTEMAAMLAMFSKPAIKPSPAEPLAKVA